jgi:preprotein translocase subunit SecA
MKHLGMEEDVPIESKMVTRSIERAQKQVEGRNFEIRKHLLQYDDVMNKQREAVYRLRRDVLDGKEGRGWVLNAAKQVVGSLVDVHCPEDKHFDDWDQAALDRELDENFGLGLKEAGVVWEKVTRVALEETLIEVVEGRYLAREGELGEPDFRQLERYVILSVLDAQWKDHLLALDHLKEGIGMRAYGQRDPLVEYKRESFGLFQSMMERVEDQAVQYMYRLDLARVGPERRHHAPMRESKAEATALQGERQEAKHSPGSGSPTTVRRQEPKVGRNDPCPCGSGKKYKKCHGANEGAAAS